MSIIENAERYMKRYDYLIAKRERRYKQGKRLSQDEDEELLKLRPSVFTPIIVMFELLHDTVKSNQTLRKETNYHHHHKHSRAQKQSGGASSSNASANAIAIAAVSAASAGGVPPSTPKSEGEKGDGEGDSEGEGDEEEDADAKEAQRLSELEESLMPLLTKIIVYIEQNKNKDKKKEEEEEEEKYPDIGTSAKNSAILVIRRIKKWWNDLIAGGSSDLSSKINLKKAIPQLPNNPDDMNKLVDKATAAIHEPLQKIEKLLSNDVRDIASSSVEGIMNALSLIPGIGTTLQLWRLLQNVIVIMSKSVTTMAGAKTQGVELKTNVQALKGDMEAMAQNQAQGAVAGAIPGAPDIPGAPAIPGAPDIPGAPAVPGAPDIPGAPAAPAVPGAPAAPAVPGAPAAPAAAAPPAVAAPPAAAPAAAPPAAAAPAPQAGGAAVGGKSNHIRSIKKYKREYKQSIREIRKTRKKLMKFMRNIM